MNYKHVIAFLGTKQQKMWVKPSGRLILFEDNIDRNRKPVENQFGSLLEAYPEIWKVQSVDSSFRRIVPIDGSLVKWYQILNSRIVRQSPLNRLAIESSLYIYDTVTQSIIFNNSGLPKQKLEELFPDIEKLIDSGDSEMGIK